jgi:hypothetical protein
MPEYSGELIEGKDLRKGQTFIFPAGINKHRIYVLIATGSQTELAQYARLNGDGETLSLHPEAQVGRVTVDMYCDDNITKGSTNE